MLCLADVSFLLSNCVVESSSETTHRLQHDQTLFLQRVWLVRLMLDGVSEKSPHPCRVYWPSICSWTSSKALCVLSPLSYTPLCLELSGDFHVASVNHPVIADKLGPELRQEEQLFCRVTKHNPPTCNAGDTRPILLNSLLHFFPSDCKIFFILAVKKPNKLFLLFLMLT